MVLRAQTAAADGIVREFVDPILARGGEGTEALAQRRITTLKSKLVEENAPLWMAVKGELKKRGLESLIPAD